MTKKATNKAPAKSSAQSAIDSIKALTQGRNKAIETEKAPESKFGKLNKPKGAPGTGKGKYYVPLGIGSGGVREGSGRPPSGAVLERRTRKAQVNSHFGEEVEVEMLDPKTGKMVRVKKPRIVVQIERLYLASRNKDGTYNVQAIKDWLDRALGKAPQPHIGDEEEDPIQHQLGADRIIEGAYGSETED